MKVVANGISLEVEDSRGSGPAVLLVMGLGMQLVAWPPAFVQALEDEGYRVIRFDNRDIGLSQFFDHLGVPNLLWESFKHRFGFPVHAPYSLGDMAQDALGLLDALGIERAHVVGVSMGGMIAQRVALAAPQRVLSLTSVMSSSGARYLPGPKPHVLKALFTRPKNRTEAAIIDNYMHLLRALAGPGFPLDEGLLRSRVVEATRRSYHPAGVMRQMAAVAADTRRADELPRIKAPTLVVHGTDDGLVPFPCGQDTARRIAGAKLVPIEGMGHDLPPGVVERLLLALQPHLRVASQA
jgi:pimeloyl-ACP methyl ester carboxylesterase